MGYLGSYFGSWFGASAGASCAWYYSDSQGVIDLLGQESLAIVSDLDDPTIVQTDFARVLRAGKWSDSYIDTELNAHVHKVPLQGMSASLTIYMRDISNRLTCWWLYQNKGIKDVDPAKPPEGVAGWFNNHKKIADQMLKRIWLYPQDAARKRPPRSPIGVVIGRRRYHPLDAPILPGDYCGPYGGRW